MQNMQPAEEVNIKEMGEKKVKPQRGKKVHLFIIEEGVKAEHREGYHFNVL